MAAQISSNVNLLLLDAHSIQVTLTIAIRVTDAPAHEIGYSKAWLPVVQEIVFPFDMCLGHASHCYLLVFVVK